MRPAPSVLVTPRADGTTLVASGHAPIADPPLVIDVLAAQARARGEAPFLAERDAGGAWRVASYRALDARATAIAASLMRAGVAAGDRIALLADNGIDAAAVTFAAMRCGAILAPLSTAHADADELAPFARLIGAVAPRVVIAASAARFGRALDAVGAARIVTFDGTRGTPLDALAATGPDDAALAARRAAIARATPAKLFFTSGSTGQPKGVINTHGQLAAAMAMYGQVAERFDPPYTLLDWLPWSHVYGGNVQLHEVLRAGGVLYIDGGRPTPERFAQTLANLREVSPSLYGSVPAAFTMLADALEADADLAARFFARLRGLRYGGGALPQEAFDRLQRLARAITGRSIGFSSGWGMTETSGCGVSCYWDVTRAGLLGLPLPGVTLKLVPTDDGAGARMELRIRGPQVFDGYLDGARDAFDEEGFFRTGDAVTWADAAEPRAGLAFAGRLAEQFKLATGTWVQAGTLRLALLDALAPIAREAVIAAPDRPWLGALVWVDAPADAQLRARIGTALADYNARAGGTSRRIQRALLVAEPLSLAAGEITDKRTVNQRRVLERRRPLVEALYADPPGADIIDVRMH